MVHQSRPFFSASLYIAVLQLLSLFMNTVSGEIECLMSAYVEDCSTRNSFCTCVTDGLYCYKSTIMFFDESGELRSIDDLGCLSFPRGECPMEVIEVALPYKGYQIFNCCRDTDFCNENLTIDFYYDIPTQTSPNSMPILTSTSTPSPSVDSTPKVSWVFVVGISSFVLAFITAVAIVVGLVMYYGNCCSISYLCKCGWKACYLCRHRRSRVCADKTNETDFNSIPMEIDPVPISDNDITITSGSGKGMPHLVQRTIARSIVLGNPIGGGRFGQVYMGYYQGETYAVKKFFSRDEHSWYHESEIYNTINMRHDNILSCFATDILSNNGVTELWLITQYQPRGSLYDVLSMESIDQETVLKFAGSICRGLTYLHDELSGTQGKPAIAHRDIKSKNILVKENYTCCIGDFGMALVKNSSSPNLTTPQNIREGTKRYMAPEVLAETINLVTFESFLRTDMYAYGLVLWEVCRRCDFQDEPEEYELPFMSMVPPDPSFEDMREMVVERGCSPQIPNRWANSELMKGLTMLMKECWYSDPAARPTAFYVKKKLERITQNSHLKFPSEKT